MSTTTSRASPPPLPQTTPFEVYVSKDTFKFNAAHFVAFPGFRERLHGHNYRLAVRCSGRRSMKIGADGYVIDFGCIKAVCKDVCKRMNEHFLCPMYSNVLKIQADDDTVHIECEDSSVFVFPRQDCILLPIVHATAEEIAIYLWSEILKGLQADYLIKRGIDTLEVIVAESVGQEATFRWPVPVDAGSDFTLDVRSFVSDGDVIPMPCPSDTERAKTKALPVSSCSCKTCGLSVGKLSEQLEQLAQAINKKGGLAQTGDVSAKDLKKMLEDLKESLP